MFLILSTICACLSPFIGIQSILKGHFKPQRMTRFLILLVSSLFVATLLATKNQAGLYIAIAQLFGSLVIFILSIKHGLGGTSKFDFFILFLALSTLVIWQTTANPLLGLIMSILTDLIGFIPTLIKTWHYPATEDWRFYFSDVLAATFSLLSLSTLNQTAVIFPAYILLINLISVFLINKKSFSWS